MKAVLVCIAKDEDRYIDEWLDYHFKLGFCEAHVYQNDWRYGGALRGDGRVKLYDFPGRDRQIKAYNDFLRRFTGGDVDFAAFFDVDEFMCLEPGLSLDCFLSRFTGDMGVALNWKCFGDSGLSAPIDGDYTVVRRFTRCQAGFDKHVKTIVNMRCVDRSTVFPHNPHCLNESQGPRHVRSADGQAIVSGPYNHGVHGCPAWLNHYFCKTRAEFVYKIRRGRIDIAWPADSRLSMGDYERRWRSYNRNESEDFTARDFYLGTGSADPEKPDEAQRRP